MQEKLLLTSSVRVAHRLTDIFDFTWPTAVAIWNLRWQVTGLVTTCPLITEDELAGRFTSGSGITGANLRRACLEKTWEEQQQEFARFLLFEFCALYESWCEASLIELGAAIDLKKDLQFPSSVNPKGKPKGIQHVLNIVNATTSAGLNASIYPKLVSNKKYSPLYTEHLLICYRYFKETRNFLVHGSTALPELLAAETAYSSESAASLGVRERPQFNPYVVGQDVKLALRGVVGFGEVVLRLISTLDIEFSKSALAEPVFLNRWKSVHGNYAINLPTDRERRKRRIRAAVKKIGLPAPSVTKQFEAWLRGKHLIS